MQDLRSRLMGGTVIELDPPEQTAIIQVLAIALRDAGLTVPPALIEETGGRLCLDDFIQDWTCRAPFGM